MTAAEPTTAPVYVYRPSLDAIEAHARHAARTAAAYLAVAESIADALQDEEAARG